MITIQRTTDRMSEDQLTELRKTFERHPIVVAEAPLGVNQWDAAGDPHVMVRSCKWGQYEGWIDCGYGYDCLWDGRVWNVARHGVFTEQVIFVSDYYGYSKGRLFIAADVAR